jgi:hypothetical protein
MELEVDVYLNPFLETVYSWGWGRYWWTFTGMLYRISNGNEDLLRRPECGVPPGQLIVRNPQFIRAFEAEFLPQCPWLFTEGSSLLLHTSPSLLRQIAEHRGKSGPVGRTIVGSGNRSSYFFSPTPRQTVLLKPYAHREYPIPSDLTVVIDDGQSSVSLYPLFWSQGKYVHSFEIGFSAGVNQTNWFNALLFTLDPRSRGWPLKAPPVLNFPGGVPRD